MISLLVAVGLVACSKDEIDVHRPGADYNRHGVLAAIDRFTAAGRTPEAYGRLVADIGALRPGMDETVADEAELQLVVLGLTPVEQVAGLPPSTRAQKLATTVWSVAMSAPVTAIDPQLPRANEGDPALPGESADAYVERLCGAALAVECMFIVPEAQAQFVEAVATERMARRTKHSVEECSACASDPGWAAAVAKWEGLEISTHAQAASTVKMASPDRWPVAGVAASAWAPVPTLDVADSGEWSIDARPIEPGARSAGLAVARKSSDVLGVKVGPGVRADVLAPLIDAAGAAGFREVRVEARLALYPWSLRAYHFATGARGKKPPWRPVDTVQVLLRSVDAHGTAGEIAHL